MILTKQEIRLAIQALDWREDRLQKELRTYLERREHIGMNEEGFVVVNDLQPFEIQWVEGILNEAIEQGLIGIDGRPAPTAVERQFCSCCGTLLRRK